MEYVWKEGDEFKMIPIKGSPRMRCRYPDKTFIVHSVDGTYVRYIDTRTNQKCRCRYCRIKLVTSFSSISGKMEKEPYKEIGVYEITLVRTKNQRQREISLKLLDI